MPMMQAWRVVLGLTEDFDDLMTMNKVGKVFTLPFIVEALIKRFADLDAELYLGWRADLFTAFRSIHFGGQFRDFASHLSDSLLINIRFCAHELDKRAPEKVVSPEDLATLREAAWALYEAVLASDLPPHLFRYLLDYIYLILSAIDDYNITGATALEHALNAAIGTVATDRTTAAEVKQTPLGERFWALVSKVGLLLQLAKSATELAEGVQKLLTNKT